MKTPARRTLKTVATGALAATFLAVGVAAASAHVHAVADDPAADGYTHVTFSVPNESATAKTNKLVVKLPVDPPFTSVSVQQLDGWSAKVVTTTLPKPVTVGGSEVTRAATSVEWTADPAHELGQNEYQSFSLSVGKLPAAGTTVALPVTQSYTDGTVVNWDEKTVEGQEEPEHPAPYFVTTAADGANDPAAGSDAGKDAAGTLGDPAILWGIGLGAAGLLLGGTALGLVISRRSKPGTTGK